MNLEPVIQSKVSQREKTNLIFTHMCGIWRGGTDEPICRAAVETQMWRVVLWTRGGGGRNWEGSTKACALPCIELDDWWKFAVWCRGLKSDALWEPGGVGWGRKWREIQEGKDNTYTYGWFMLMYGRAQHNIVKQLSSN